MQTYIFFLPIITSKLAQMEIFTPLKKVAIKMHHLNIIGSYSVAFRKCLEALLLPLVFIPKPGCECLGLNVFKAQQVYMQPLQSVLPEASNTQLIGEYPKLCVHILAQSCSKGMLIL